MVSTRGSKARQNDELEEPSASVQLGKRRRPRKSGAPSTSFLKATQSGTQTSEDIESHLASVSSGVANLRHEIKRLRNQNEELQARIEALHEADDVSMQPKRGKRGGESLESLKSRVKDLMDEVSRLQFARERDKKKIRKLRKKEIEADAADLQGDLTFVADSPLDTADQMRKLLRRFYELVTSPSLEEGEECCICCEKLDLQSGNARSLQCQHTICVKCLGQWELQQPTCPTCREPIGDEVEEINCTATQQWDALLAVAADWARIDNHGGDEAEDTEEEEVPFIDDDNHEPDSGDVDEGSANDDPAPAEDEEDARIPQRSPRSNNRVLVTPPPGDEPDDADVGSPQDNANANSSSRASYMTSPSTEKRKRLEDLAEKRRLKKRY